MTRAQGSLISQVMPGSGVDTTLITVPAEAAAVEITRVFIANTTAGALMFRLGHDRTATTLSAATALYWDVSIAANTTLALGENSETFGVHLRPGSSLLGRTSAPGLTFSVYGVTATVAERIRGV